LHETAFSPAISQQIDDITTLANEILLGVDSNNNGEIQAITGEGGASTAYEHAYYLADMELLPGARRIPPPAASSKP
jgi:hypothetical protein